MGFKNKIAKPPMTEIAKIALELKAQGRKGSAAPGSVPVYRDGVGRLDRGEPFSAEGRAAFCAAAMDLGVTDSDILADVEAAHYQRLNAAELEDSEAKKDKLWETMIELTTRLKAHREEGVKLENAYRRTDMLRRQLVDTERAMGNHCAKNPRIFAADFISAINNAIRDDTTAFGQLPHGAQPLAVANDAIRAPFMQR